MKIIHDTGTATYRIRACQAGGILVGDERLTRSAVVLPERLIRDWPPNTFAELDAAHFEALAELDPEVVLLGTGATLRFPHPRVTAPLTRRSIGVEVMDTAAACRTYNVLMAEDRNVAAALLMI